MIEEFIHNNRPSFEEDLPPGHLERFIKRPGLSSDSLRDATINRYLIVAASIVVLITISLVALLIKGNVSASEYLLSNITPELHETETYYQTEINHKMEILSDRNEIDKSILTDILEMDEGFETIRKDLEKNPQDERLINAALKTYQMKLDLLNEIIDRLKL